jgi:molybdate transport system substrate-binding protein
MLVEKGGGKFDNRKVVNNLGSMRSKLRQALLWGCLAILLSIVSTYITSIALHPDRHIVQRPAPTSTILLAAAASLQQALQEITPLYTTANPTNTVNYNFAASGALQQQIERGAPVDVFISAADKQMNALETKGLLVAGTRQNLLTNQLVLIAPKSSPIVLTNLQQLTQPAVKRIAIGETRTVPAGQYAVEVFQNLGIFDRVKSKFVLGNNVRSVLTAVESGNVDAGIVYLTDIRGSDRIRSVEIVDRKLHAPIDYPIAIIKSSKSPNAASKYINFLQTNTAKAIFKKYKFGISQP